MKLWLEWGPIRDAISFGVGYCWEDQHLKLYRVNIDFAHWYINLYISLGEYKRS